MANFKFKAISFDGEKVEGVIKAKDSDSAVIELKQQVQTVESIKEVKETRKSKNRTQRKNGFPLLQHRYTNYKSRWMKRKRYLTRNLHKMKVRKKMYITPTDASHIEYCKREHDGYCPFRHVKCYGNYPKT